MPRWNRTLILLVLLGVGLTSSNAEPTSGGAARFRFEISFPERLQKEPLDGRILLLFSRDFKNEPRFPAVNRPSPQPFFGVDVEGLKPGQPAVFDEQTLGFPLDSIKEIPAGEYNVQAVLNVYTTFHRSDGHVVKMHMDQWEGQQCNTSPGNLYSRPEKLKLDPAAGGTIRIALTQRIPPIPPPKDTRDIKNIKIKSERVSRFWG